jgi:Xaa-Pro aminopeptidase
VSEAKIDAGAFEEMEGRAAAATPGSWDRLRNSVVLMDDNGREIVTLGKHGTSDDLNFIASLRADVPNLIADLHAARAEVERLRAERGEREIGFAEAAYNIALSARAEERKAIADDLHGIGLTEAALPGEAEVARRLEKRIRARGGRS